MKNNKVLTALLSLVIALGLWVYVVTVVSPESDAPYTVPVTFQGEETLKDRGLMRMPGSEQSVAVRIQGNRSDLNQLSQASLLATVDLGLIQEAGVYQLNVGVSVTDSSVSISVLNKQPKAIEVTIVDYSVKEVPVELSYTGEMKAKDLILDRESAVLSDHVVAISGPAEVVDQIHHANIEIDVTNLKESIDQNYRYQLMDVEGTPVDSRYVTTNVAEINVKMTVQHYKEVPLVAQLVYGGGATEQNTKVTVEPNTIAISGSEEALKNITEILLDPIDLTELTASGTVTRAIKLPDTVTNRSGLTIANVKVEFVGLLSRTLNVSDFQLINANVPDGYQIEIVTKRLPVTVRGPSNLVTKLTANDIQVSVDCSGLGMGNTITAAATVKLPYDSVGTVGKYSVSLKLTEIIPDESGDPTGNT